MPDYYPVLARAVVDLETNDAATRAELYERARRVIVAELRKQNPNISALAMTREQATLEADIRRIEAELAPPAPKRDRDRKARDFAAPDELGGLPKALAAMLFGIAYLTAIIAFCSVIYIRGLALVYAHVIGYPVLLGTMAILACLFVPLSRSVFRKMRVLRERP